MPGLHDSPAHAWKRGFLDRTVLKQVPLQSPARASLRANTDLQDAACEPLAFLWTGTTLTPSTCPVLRPVFVRTAVFDDANVAEAALSTQIRDQLHSDASTGDFCHFFRTFGLQASSVRIAWQRLRHVRSWKRQKLANSSFCSSPQVGFWAIEEAMGSERQRAD